MLLRCRNCQRNTVADVAVGHTVAEYLRQNSECPICKVDGSAVYSDGSRNTHLEVIGPA
jgi:hypothetical protein